MINLLKTIGGWFLDMIESAVFALSLFVLVYVFLAQPHQVSGNSMYPNFHNGEYLLTNKLAYRFGTPRRGEVIVFKAPGKAHCPTGGACDFIKRIIGQPGDRLTLRGGQFSLNGQILDEPYLAAELKTPGDNYLAEGREIILGEDEYFVAGDNRLGSSDSRAWGPVKAKSIVGRAWIRYWPLNQLGLVPNYLPVNAR